MKPIVCLLIDDDAEEAEIFNYALEELNNPVKCITAKSGKEAISYLHHSSSPVDYIFLDMNMPRMNGLQCLKELRKLQVTANTRIVLYSSTFIEEKKDELIEAGATAFLEKTGSVFELQNSLFRLFAEQDALAYKLSVA